MRFVYFKDFQVLEIVFRKSTKPNFDHQWLFANLLPLAILPIRGHSGRRTTPIPEELAEKPIRTEFHHQAFLRFRKPCVGKNGSKKALIFFSVTIVLPIAKKIFRALRQAEFLLFVTTEQER